MAQLLPDLPPAHAMPLGLMREREVLQQLADGLPQEFLVFHNVNWSTGQLVNWSSVTNGIQYWSGGPGHDTVV